MPNSSPALVKLDFRAALSSATSEFKMGNNRFKEFIEGPPDLCVVADRARRASRGTMAMSVVIIHGYPAPFPNRLAGPAPARIRQNRERRVRFRLIPVADRANIVPPFKQP